MAFTKKILTSLHGKRVGISHDNKLVIDGFTVPKVNNSGAVQRVQGNPFAFDATGVLAAWMMVSGIVTSTTAAAVTATVNAGVVMDSELGKEVAIGDGFEWSVINTGPNTFTLAASTGHTLVGSGVVAASTSGRFFSKRTAVSTWVTYRLS